MDLKTKPIEIYFILGITQLILATRIYYLNQLSYRHASLF